MLKIQELVRKKCFYERPDGTTGIIVHKSVLLNDGTVVRWNKRSGAWTIQGPERFDTAVATSLNTRAMTVANEKGRMRRAKEEWFAFENFAKAMEKLTTIDTIVEIVTYLGGNA